MTKWARQAGVLSVAQPTPAICSCGDGVAEVNGKKGDGNCCISCAASQCNQARCAPASRRRWRCAGGEDRCPRATRQARSSASNMASCTSTAGGARAAHLQ
eukprot:1242025-Alexandrium_andersonii.AAC.1